MKNKLINNIKDTKAGFFISILLSFMLMFYEPLNLFASNRGDFEFSIFQFFPFVLIQTFILLAILSLIFIIVRCIHKNLYIFFVVLFLIISICFYIQGNYLAGSLPSIEGVPVNFSDYVTERIVSLVLILVVSGVIIFVLCKYKFKTIEKVAKYTSLLIIAMLSTSMISFMFSKDFFADGVKYLAEDKELFNYSSDKNYIIFLLDAVDSTTFNDELKKLDKEYILNDFTYFPDTVGSYPFTKVAIPFIFSSTWYEHEIPFSEYYTNSIDNSPILKKLEDEDYILNLYEEELLGYNSENKDRFRNLKEFETFNYSEMVNQEIKLILYKYLPFQLKSLAHPEDISLIKTKHFEGTYDYNNVTFYNKLKSESITKTDEKVFNYIHIEGAHNPQRYDINLNIVKDGKHEGNLDACITILEAYLDKLKESDVYDNSVIIVLSDHGYKETAVGRQNPILYIKGLGEKHELEVSDKKVSYENLEDAFVELADGKNASELFEEIDNTVRRYMFYRLKTEYSYREMTLEGHAWELENLKETGRTFEEE